MTRIVFFEMMEKSNESFFVICVGRFFFIPIENGRLVRKIYSSFFYMSLKRNFCEGVLWIETFIRDAILIATRTTLAALFPTQNRSAINFMTSYASSLTERFEVIVDEFVFILVQKETNNLDNS